MRMNDGQPHRKRLTATKVAPYIFIAPAVTYFVCMSIIPIVMALPISLTDWSALTPDRNFVGLENYRKLLTDGEFWRSCLTMLKFFLYVPLVMLLGLGAAMLLNTGVRGMKFFRVLFYSPVITSTVAAALLFEWFYQPSFGLFNNILRVLGLPPSTWLNMPNTAFWSILIFMLWKNFGASMLIYLAGLQDIPQDVRGQLGAFLQDYVPTFEAGTYISSHHQRYQCVHDLPRNLCAARHHGYAGSENSGKLYL
mgnify:CR=1 FL=1